MLQQFESIFTFDLTLGDVASRLVVSLVCGLLVSLFYRWSHRSTSYSASFVIALVALSMITASVIMVIGNNLARAFGLVGAMSIVRFRSAVKETTDIVFIFFALAMGMAVGVGLYVVGLTASVFVGIVIWILTLANYGRIVTREYLLQFTYSGSDEGEPDYVAILRRYAKRFRLINVKSFAENGDTLELSYYVILRRSEESGSLVQEIGRLSGVGHVNMFFDEAEV